MEEQMKMIKGILKEVQYRKKSYADARRVDLKSYKVGDNILLRLRPQNSSIKFGKGAKLSP
jgi:hypothetical protein